MPENSIDEIVQPAASERKVPSFRLDEDERAIMNLMYKMNGAKTEESLS